MYGLVLLSCRIAQFSVLVPSLPERICMDLTLHNLIVIFKFLPMQKSISFSPLDFIVPFPNDHVTFSVHCLSLILTPRKNNYMSFSNTPQSLSNMSVSVPFLSPVFTVVHQLDENDFS